MMIQRYCFSVAAALIVLLCGTIVTGNVCGNATNDELITSTSDMYIEIPIECTTNSTVRYTKLQSTTSLIEIVGVGATMDLVLFDELVTVNGDVLVELFDGSQLTRLSFPKLKTIYGAFLLTLQTSSRIYSLSFPVLERVDGEFLIEVGGGSELGFLQFPKMKQLHMIEVVVFSSLLNSIVLGSYTNGYAAYVVSHDVESCGSTYLLIFLKVSVDACAMLG